MKTSFVKLTNKIPIVEWYDLFENMFWWLLFGIVHSVMANHRFKELLPIKGRLYRIIYNIIATVLLFLVLYNQPSITSLLKKGFNLSGINLVVFLVCSLIGGIIAALGLLAWDLLAFLGLTHDPKELDKNGIYAFSRHPVYFGAIMLFIAPLFLGITAETLSWLCGAGGYFIVGTIFEERNLNTYFADYAEYKLNVGRFFPWNKRHLNFLRRSLGS